LSEPLRDRLAEVLQQATAVAETSSDAIELGRWFLHERERLQATARALADLDPRERELLLAEAQREAIRRPEALASARTAADVVRGWTSLLLAAADKVASDRRDAELYAASDE
jgi:hypothetical protein